MDFIAHSVSECHISLDWETEVLMEEIIRTVEY